MPTVSASARSLSPPGHPNPGRRIDARLLTFRARAADQAHATSTPGTTWPGTRAPARLIPKDTPEPPVSMPSQSFDASTAHAHPEIAPGPSAFWNVFLVPTWRGHCRAFSLDAPHDSLQLTQFQGGLTPAPAGPTPEGQLLHLLHSSAYIRGLLHDSSFSVRDTRRGCFARHCERAARRCRRCRVGRIPLLLVGRRLDRAAPPRLRERARRAACRPRPAS